VKNGLRVRGEIVDAGGNPEKSDRVSSSSSS
jgi:hypothetical protein